MVTRNIPGYLDLSAFVIDELRKVGVEATLRPVESGQLGPLLSRGEFQMAVNSDRARARRPGRQSLRELRLRIAQKLRAPL